MGKCSKKSNANAPSPLRCLEELEDQVMMDGVYCMRKARNLCL